MPWMARYFFGIRMERKLWTLVMTAKEVITCRFFFFLIHSIKKYIVEILFQNYYFIFNVIGYNFLTNHSFLLNSISVLFHQDHEY